MPAKHPLSANDKLLRRFYEPLVLLAVIDRGRGAQRPDLVTDLGLQGRQKMWRNFLDQLSFLCDSEKGGDTVTAIAAQKTVERTVFWVASNSDARTKAKQHVEWLLLQLNKVYDAGPKELQELKRTITTRCIEFSSSRMKTYIRFLLMDIKILKNRDVLEGSEDDELLKALAPFEECQNDLGEICAYAYEFRSMEAVQILSRRHIAHETRGLWSDIRHNIGRLGCWTKAVQKLFEAKKTFSNELEDAAVKLVQPNGPVNYPPTPPESSIKKLVGRMLAANQQDMANGIVQLLREYEPIFPLMDEFRKRYSDLHPRPHAELLALEWFFQHNLEFVHDDKYIGCSKPSCYCCGLYMKINRGQFEPRPCHGNLWLNWAPPIPLPDTMSARGAPTQHQRPQQHPAFQLLQKMTDPIRRELLEQIISRRPRRDKMFDSTTGMSSVVINAIVASGEVSTPTVTSVGKGSVVSRKTAQKEEEPHNIKPGESQADGTGTRLDAFHSHNNSTDRAPMDDSDSSSVLPYQQDTKGYRTSATEISNYEHADENQNRDGDSDVEEGGVLVFRGRK